MRCCFFISLFTFFSFSVNEPSREVSAASERAPFLALIATYRTSPESTLVLADPVNGAVGGPVARFTHQPDATVEGVWLPGSHTIVAVADRSFASDRSF